jgi:hypothetical protein
VAVCMDVDRRYGAFLLPRVTRPARILNEKETDSHRPEIYVTSIMENVGLLGDLQCDTSGAKDVQKLSCRLRR